MADGAIVTDVALMVKYWRAGASLIEKDVVAANAGKLSNVDARKWYLENEAQIVNRIDKSLSLEEQAKQAFELRNTYRTQARELMADRATAQKLYQEEPNLTWDQVVEKASDKGFTGNALWKEIIESSSRSRPSVNQGLGLE